VAQGNPQVSGDTFVRYALFLTAKAFGDGWLRPNFLSEHRKRRGAPFYVSNP
jgi:hypothetical protein